MDLVYPQSTILNGIFIRKRRLIRVNNLRLNQNDLTFHIIQRDYFYATCKSYFIGKVTVIGSERARDTERENENKRNRD